VSHALKVGYKHIDAAYVYGNEDEVGQGLAEAFNSGLKRQDVFITTSTLFTTAYPSNQGILPHLTCPNSVLHQNYGVLFTPE
jgi:diketogulonate reductase-like aldo/keto reductase